MEPWRVLDARNGGVDAHNRDVEAQNEAVDGLFISGRRYASL
jgi:hypothetical protein